MTIRDEIIAIANQLANRGKKPTVALIKNKLSNSAPLPIIISTLKGWQHEPENTELPTVNKEPEQTVEAASITLEMLEQRLAPLKADIDEIKQLLRKLVESKGG
ncbi:hypothetical protein [Thalassotalea atypica]|uniref:hypothetical protein n=1 Tax=Thalassotalea atypica TaxID=2054316 RepID=UPI0025748F8A|nr:hypothetical protein [Thalassotalea atypica]